MREKPLISFIIKFIISGRLVFLLLLVSHNLFADVISPPHLRCEMDIDNIYCILHYEYRYNGSCYREKLSKLYACKYERDENPKEIEITSLDFRNRQECHGGYVPPKGGECEFGIDCVEEDTIIVPYGCYYLKNKYLGLSINKDCINCDMGSEPYEELYSHHSCAIPKYDKCVYTDNTFENTETKDAGSRDNNDEYKIERGCNILNLSLNSNGHSPDLIIFLFFALFTLSGFILYRKGY